MIKNQSFADLVACSECGQLHHYRSIPERQVAVCTYCNSVLYRNRSRMLEKGLALTITGLILFVITNFFPLLGLKAQGVLQEITLWKASVAFWKEDFHLLAVLLVFNLILFPLFELFSLLWIMLSICLDKPNQLASHIYRWMNELKPWGMMEVFMLGALVAVVKLGDLATLVLGPAFWSFSFLIICMAAATSVLDPFVVWGHLKPEREHD